MKSKKKKQPFYCSIVLVLHIFVNELIHNDKKQNLLKNENY